MFTNDSFIVGVPQTLKETLSSYSDKLSSQRSHAWLAGGFIIFTFGLDWLFIREKVKDEPKVHLAIVF
jgi:hypothetical protein